MDVKIRNLKSTSHLGRHLTRQQLADLQTLVRNCPGLSRHELAQTACEHLNWYTPNGRPRTRLAMSLLERLEGLGILNLPAKDLSKQHAAPRPPAYPDIPMPPPLCAELPTLLPLRWHRVVAPDEVRQFNEWVQRYHYLGYRRPLGPHLRYVLRDAQGRDLGCLLIEYATRILPCRDKFIGWNKRAREKRLEQVLNNSRFLIFPWVRVANLASKALALATAQLADDWQQVHGYRPLLLETFVDRKRFTGACYRAANWQHLGNTRAKGARSEKAVLVYPLDPDFRSLLRHGRRPPPPKRPAPVASDRFVEMWRVLVGAIEAAADAHDRQWRRRRRVLNTLLVVLFVFRLVCAKDAPGYRATLAGLWDQCRTLGLAVPQPEPVAPSAICRARAKVDEALFRSLHAEVLQQAGKAARTRLWNGHRVFAVDGSKLNLPRQLIGANYLVPTGGYYPQGLLSCLYQLRQRLPVDFDLHAHSDERRAALNHLPALTAGDVVVYDRGYFSFAFLRAHIDRGLHPVFRLSAKACGAVAAFAAGDQADAEVDLDDGTLRLRLMKYRVKGSDYLLGTTLRDRRKYPVSALSELYHERWGIEELFKTSKQTLAIECWHAHSERGVKQELYAHFVLLALTRLFVNHGEAQLARAGRGARRRQLNFRAGLHTVGRHLEGLLLRQAALVAEVVQQVFAHIVPDRQKVRPGRCYPRVSRKPVGKWTPAKLEKLAKIARAIFIRGTHM